MNWYVYANNNPTSLIDPTGLYNTDEKQYRYSDYDNGTYNWYNNWYSDWCYGSNYWNNFNFDDFGYSGTDSSTHFDFSKQFYYTGFDPLSDLNTNYNFTAQSFYSQQGNNDYWYENHDLRTAVLTNYLEELGDNQVELGQVDESVMQALNAAMGTKPHWGYNRYTLSTLENIRTYYDYDDTGSLLTANDIIGVMNRDQQREDFYARHGQFGAILKEYSTLMSRYDQDVAFYSFATSMYCMRFGYGQSSFEKRVNSYLDKATTQGPKLPDGMRSYDINRLWKTQPADKNFTDPAKVKKMMDIIKSNGPEALPEIPVLVHNGEPLIVNGHHRLQAFKNLGYKRVPIKYIHKNQIPLYNRISLDDLLYWKHQ